MYTLQRVDMIVYKEPLFLAQNLHFERKRIWAKQAIRDLIFKLNFLFTSFTVAWLFNEYNLALGI